MNLQVKLVVFDTPSIDKEISTKLEMRSYFIPQRGDLVRWEHEDTIYKGTVDNLYWDFVALEVEIYVRNVESED